MTQLITEAELPDKALALIQPWAYFVVAGLKDIENRSRRTKYRGTVAIQASKKPDTLERTAALNVLYSVVPLPYGQAKQRTTEIDRELRYGAIIGTVDIVDCIDHSDSPWFFGPFGYVLENPRMLAAPIFVTGQRGFYNWRDHRK